MAAQLPPRNRLYRPARLGSPPPSRRSLLKAALAAGGALAGAGSLAGCGSPVAAAAGPDLIRFWNLFSGGDGVLMVDLLAAVREDAPELVIDPVTLAWGAPYYTKLAMASAGGRPPEVAIMHMQRLAGYVPGGLLQPFDFDLLAQFDVTEQDFVAEVLEQGQFDGETYAIPLDTHPFITFYNTEIAEQAGLIGDDGMLVPLDSPEALLEAGRALAEVTGGFGISTDAVGSWRFFYGLFRQTGATWEIDPDASEPDVDRDAMIRTVEFMQEMFDGTVANPDADYAAAIADFVAGRSGILFNGVWEVPTMQRNEIPFNGAPFPTIFEEPAGYADAHTFVLPRKNDPQPERYENSHLFVASMLKNSLLWAQAGHIPSYLPIVETEEYQELVPQANYAEAAEIAVFDPPAWFTGSGSAWQNQMNQALASGLAGGLSAEQVVDRMIATTARMMSTPQPA